MLGFRFMIWSLAALVKKLPQVVFISVLPILAIVAIVIATDSVANRTILVGMDVWVRLIGFLLVPVPFMSWAAVHWQRSVVLDTKPWPFPLAPITAIWGSMWRVLLVMLVIFGVGCAYFYLVDALATSELIDTFGDVWFGVIVIASFAITLVGTTFCFLRLSISFVGAAVADRTTMKESWMLTKPYRGSLVVICISVMVFFMFVLVVIGNFASGFMFSLYATLFFSAWMTIGTITEIYRYVRAQNDVTEVFG